MTARKSKASISALRPPPVEKVSKVGARDRTEMPRMSLSIVIATRQKSLPTDDPWVQPGNA